MKLYTKTGDDGTTGLIGGARVPKSDPRVATYGDVDETNAAIGLAMAENKDSKIAAMLREIQSDLFVLGAELATPRGQEPGLAICETRAAQLERWIDEVCAELAPLKNFILPGGTAASAALHFARGVCRRAERSIVALSAQQAVRQEVIIYVNRLSDLLFALARRANQESGCPDVIWAAPKAP